MENSFASFPFPRRLLSYERDYRAAGVLPWRHHPETREVEVLLASEWTEGTRRCRYFTMPGGCYDGPQCEFPHYADHIPQTPDERHGVRLNPLGGKREEDEILSSITASREFHEETNFDLISWREALAFVTQSGCQCLRLDGAYDLYIAPLQPALIPNLTKAYARLERKPPLTCADALYWIPVSALLNVQWNKTLGYHVLDCSDGFLEHPLPISNLLWSLCHKHKAELNKLVLL